MSKILVKRFHQIDCSFNCLASKHPGSEMERRNTLKASAPKFGASVLSSDPKEVAGLAYAFLVTQGVGM